MMLGELFCPAPAGPQTQAREWSTVVGPEAVPGPSPVLDPKAVVTGRGGGPGLCPPACHCFVFPDWQVR